MVHDLADVATAVLLMAVAGYMHIQHSYLETGHSLHSRLLQSENVRPATIPIGLHVANPLILESCQHGWYG